MAIKYNGAGLGGWRTHVHAEADVTAKLFHSDNQHDHPGLLCDDLAVDPNKYKPANKQERIRNS